MVGSTENESRYTISAATAGPQPIDWRFDDESWVNAEFFAEEGGATVILEYGTDFILAGDGTALTGTLTLTPAFLATVPDGGGTLVVFRDTTPFQTLNLVANARFPSEGTERTLDTLAMAAIDRASEASMTRRFPKSDPLDFREDYKLPGASLRASGVDGYNASGRPVVFNASELATLALSGIDLSNLGDEVLAAISAMAPIELAAPPTSATPGVFGQLAIIPENYQVTVSGELTPDAIGALVSCSVDEHGRINFSSDGNPTRPDSGVWVTIISLPPIFPNPPTKWIMGVSVDGEFAGFWEGTGEAATPDENTTWATSGSFVPGTFSPSGTGTPTTVLAELSPRSWINTALTGEPIWEEIPSISQIQNDISENLQGLPSMAPAIITTGAFPLSGTEPATIVMAFNSPSGASGKIKSIEFVSGGSGGVEIHKMRVFDDGTWATTGFAEYTSAGAGNEVLIAGRDFPDWDLLPNETIGLNPISGGSYAFASAAGGPGYYYTAAGTITNPVSVTLTAAGAICTKIVLESDLVANQGESFIESAPSLPFLPQGWYAGVVPWTFDISTGVASSGAAGVANAIITKVPSGIDQRKIEIEFSLGSLSSTALFITSPDEGVNSGSMVRVSYVTNTLEILDRYIGDGNVGSILKSTPLRFSPVANKKYLFVWEKDGRAFTASVRDLDGTIKSSITRTGTPEGWISYPTTFGYDQGSMQGRLAFSAGSGSMKVYSVSHRALCYPEPWLYVCGDSILDGFSVSDSEKWPALARNVIGSRQICVSAIGGAVTGGAFTRMKQELQAIRPRNILICLGNNTDASFAANIAAMALWAHRYGARVYVSTVPTNSTYTTAVNALPGYVAKVPFDVAMTSGGAGTSLIEDYYENEDDGGDDYNDGVHPNAIGHEVLFDTLPPELLRPIPLNYG